MSYSLVTNSTADQSAPEKPGHRAHRGDFNLVNPVTSPKSGDGRCKKSHSQTQLEKPYTKAEKRLSTAIPRLLQRETAGIPPESQWARTPVSVASG